MVSNNIQQPCDDLWSDYNEFLKEISKYNVPFGTETEHLLYEAYAITVRLLTVQ